MKIRGHKNIFFNACILLVSIFNAPSVFGQDTRLNRDFLNFFEGQWTGEGEFANGRKIAADVSFTLSLDSSWVHYEHTDRLPNKYKAISMWSIDKTSGQFVSYIFDNFQGHRKYVGDGWKDGRLTMTIIDYYPKTGTLFQHFIYEKLSERSFKMTFETSKDGVIWKLGDYLIFNKKS